jgi:xylulokinase
VKPTAGINTSRAESSDVQPIRQTHDRTPNPNSMSYFLGIDIGTSGTKTLIIDRSGKVLAESNAKYPLHHPKPLWSEQDPEDWWTATVKTVRAVVRKAKVKPASVAAIGLSGQMHGSVFLDKRDKVLRPAILWNDQRTAAECAEIERFAGGRTNLIKLVANPALTGFTAPKILWLRRHEPKLFERTKKILLPKDEIRRRMTGDYATDVSDASGMLLLDVAKRRWSRELLHKLQLDIDLFAECFESQQVTGRLTPAAAQELGLTTACQVVGGAGDCAANAVGTGVVSSGILSTSIGTSGIMFVHSDQPKIDPAGRLHTFCHAVDGKWHMMGVSLTGGGAMQWFVERLCQDLIRQGKDPYAVLNAEARAVATGAEGLFFLPYLAGERTPHADPDARGCFVGLTLKHTRGHLARAVMEGVTYAMRDSLRIIEELKVPVRQVRVSGGGSKSPFWRQLQADMFGHPASVINCEQGPAYGVALLAAVGSGQFANVAEACEATIKVVSQTKVDRKACEFYHRAHPIYQQLYRSLQNDFKRISQLG